MTVSRDLPSSSPVYTVTSRSDSYAFDFEFLSPEHIRFVEYDHETRTEKPIYASEYDLVCIPQSKPMDDTYKGGDIRWKTENDFIRHLGKKVYITFQPDVTQQTMYSSYTYWSLKDVQNSLDKLTLICQWLRTEVNRTIKCSPQETPASLLAFMASAVESAVSAERSKQSAADSASTAAAAKNDALTAKGAVEAMKIEFTTDFNAYRGELSQTRYLSAGMSDAANWRTMADKPDSNKTTLFSGYLVDDETQSEYQEKELGRFVSDVQISSKIPKGRKFTLSLVLPTTGNAGYYLRIQWVNVVNGSAQAVVTKQFTKTASGTNFTFETVLDSDFTPSASGRLGVILTAIPAGVMAKAVFAVGGDCPSPAVAEVADLAAIAKQTGEYAQRTEASAKLAEVHASDAGNSAKNASIYKDNAESARDAASVSAQTAENALANIGTLIAEKDDVIVPERLFTSPDLVFLPGVKNFHIFDGVISTVFDVSLIAPDKPWIPGTVGINTYSFKIGDGGGVSWPSSVTWEGGTVPETLPGTIASFTFFTRDGIHFHGNLSMTPLFNAAEGGTN